MKYLTAIKIFDEISIFCSSLLCVKYFFNLDHALIQGCCYVTLRPIHKKVGKSQQNYRVANAGHSTCSRLNSQVVGWGSLK